MTSPSIPIKNDADKPRVDLIPARALLTVRKAYDYDLNVRHIDVCIQRAVDCLHEWSGGGETNLLTKAAVEIIGVLDNSTGVVGRIVPGPAAILQVGRAFGYGAKKYADDNWRHGNGLAYRRLLGAALRHCYQWSSHENLDPESGLPHLAHAAASVLMLLDLVLHKHGVDDRWVPPAERVEYELTNVVDSTWTSTFPDFGAQVVPTAHSPHEVDNDGR